MPLQEKSPFSFLFGDLSISILLGILTAFILCYVVGFSMQKKRYEHAEFIFYPERLEYIDGFLN